MITARYREYKAAIGYEEQERRAHLLASFWEECNQSGQSTTRRHIDRMLRTRGLALIRPELSQLYKKFQCGIL